jgi:hypothetical protein
MQAYESILLYNAEKPVTAYYQSSVMNCANPLNALDPFYSSFDSYHYLIHYFLHLKVDFRLAHYHVHVHHDDHVRSHRPLHD